MPYFKDRIGALDGTHILATPPPHDIVRYIGRTGKATQNVLDVVDFDLRFTYASIGQSGSMHDTNVLFHVLRHDEDTFLHPQQVSSLVLLTSLHMQNYSPIAHIFFALFQENIMLLMLDIQIGLATWHHSRVQGIMFQIGGGVLLQVVGMNTLTICIQVFAMR
jgi:hypothetical protein